MIGYIISTGKYRDDANLTDIAKDEKGIVEIMHKMAKDYHLPIVEKILNIKVNFEKNIAEYDYIDITGDKESSFVYLWKVNIL